MTIQRQYSLPNCTLILEGLSDSTANSGQLDVRPVMSILVNAECHFAGGIPTISGGREFFDSLVMAVNRYAQQFLSGVFYPQNIDNEPPLVHLQQIGQNLHRLIVQRRGDVQVGSNNGATGNTGSSAPMAIELTTVQLFDLVEAVDQFFADSQTLPALSLQLTPLEKRLVHSDRPVIKEAAPVAVGVSSLALAAAALFFLPVPEVEKPKEPATQPTPNSLSNNSGNSLAQPTGIEPPPSASPLATETPSASPLAAETPSPAATETPSASPLATETPSASPLVAETPSASPLVAETPSPSQLTANTTTTEISDPNLIVDLNRKLRDEIDRNWENRSQVDRDLAYRVSVDENGTIVNYAPDDETASNAVNLTPLPKLLPNPVPNSEANNKPIADFRVVFSSKGFPEVNPWKGLTVQPSNSTAEITDTATLRDLNQKLHQQIRENKEQGLNFPRPLVFRVAVRSDGTIVDYEARNQPAFDYVEQTPLPKLKSTGTSTSSATGSEETLAYFKVVFTPKGVPQVSPWRGFR